MNIRYTLAFVIGAVLVLILLRCCTEPDVIKGKDTVEIVTKYDTIFSTQLIHVNKWKITKVYDSVVKIDNTISRTYYDSIPDSNQTIYYKAVVNGFLDSVQVAYKLNIPLQITRTIEKNTTRIDTIKAPKTILFAGLEAGGNKTTFNLSPYVTLINKNLSYTARYGLYDKTVSLGVALKLFQR